MINLGNSILLLNFGIDWNDMSKYGEQLMIKCWRHANLVHQYFKNYGFSLISLKLIIPVPRNVVNFGKFSSIGKFWLSIFLDCSF